MEARRVQKVGQSTLSVSLPKKWVKEFNIKKGDLLVFSASEDGTLRLLPSKLVEDRRRVIEYVINSDLCDEPGMLERAIFGNYMLGRDAIVVYSSRRIKGEHLQEIRNSIRSLIGLGIIEETPTRVVLQCSIDAAKFPLNQLIRRLHTIAHTMHAESIEALLEGNEELAKEALNREVEADSIYYLIIRLLLTAQQNREVAQKIGIKNLLHIAGNRAVANFLEASADHAEAIAHSVIALSKLKGPIPGQVSTDLKKLSSLTSDVCQKAVESLFGQNFKSANKVLEAQRTIEDVINKISAELHKAELTPNVVSHLTNIVFALRVIAEYGVAIALIAVNRSLEVPSKFCSPTQTA